MGNVRYKAFTNCYGTWSSKTYPLLITDAISCVILLSVSVRYRSYIFLLVNTYKQCAVDARERVRVRARVACARVYTRFIVFVSQNLLCKIYFVKVAAPPLGTARYI